MIASLVPLTTRETLMYYAASQIWYASLAGWTIASIHIDEGEWFSGHLSVREHASLASYRALGLDPAVGIALDTAALNTVGHVALSTIHGVTLFGGSHWYQDQIAQFLTSVGLFKDCEQRLWQCVKKLVVLPEVTSGIALIMAKLLLPMPICMTRIQLHERDVPVSAKIRRALMLHTIPLGEKNW